MKLELYDPRLQKIEVLRLERRLDTHLRYLRDAPSEYSTFPLDMKAEIRRSNEVPLYRIKVNNSVLIFYFFYDLLSISSTFWKGLANIHVEILT